MRLFTSLVASVAFASASFTPSVGIAQALKYEHSGLDLKISTKSASQMAAAKTWARKYGRVLASSKGTILVVRLASPIQGEKAIAEAKRQSWTKEAEFLAPEMPLSDVRSMGVSKLDLIVREYKSAYGAYKEVAEDEEEDKGSGEELDEVPGLDFLEAYLEYKRIRAYPNDEIDLSGYLEVAKTRVENLATPVRQPRNIGTSQWEFVGPTNLDIPYRIYYGQRPINGRVNAIAVSPSDPNTIYVAGSGGGVWKSTDYGVNWSPKGDGFPLLGTSSIAIHPTQNNIVLVGTGDYDGFDTAGIGIMRSTDGGETFTQTGVNATGGSCIKSIVFDPDDPNIVVAISGKNGGGIHRSTNAGQTWTTVQSGGDWDSLSVSLRDGVNARNWYATTPGNPPRIFRSTNQGQTWAAIPVNPLTGSASTTSLATSKVFPNTLYVLSSARVLFKSDNSGATWTSISAGFPNGSSNYNWSQAWYDWHLNTSYRNNGGPNVDVVYVGLIDIVQSRDGGATWRSMGGSNWSATYSNNAITHNDQHSFAVDPSNPNRVYVGNDGGIYRANYTPGSSASNDTLTWNLLSRNLGITQFYTLAAHPTNPDYLKGGTQDNATPHSMGDLANWDNPGAGDGAGCVIGQTNPNLQYNSSQYQNIYKTTNGYSSSSTITPSWSGQSTPFIGDLWLDPNNDNILYANTNYLNRYTNGPNTWSLMLGGQVLGNRANCLAIPIGNSNRLLVGSNNGQFWRSDNQGANWTRIDRQGQANGLPNRAFTSISINPTNQNDVLVTVSGTGTAHVYRCTDVSLASPVWTSASGTGVTGLPNVPANSLARDLDKPLTTWYVGTDVGVYMTTDSGATWQDITRSRGLPNVHVTKLVAVPGTRMLNASTFGRGMWRMRLRRAEVTSVSANPNPVVGGATSTGSVTLDRVAPTGGYTVTLQENSPLMSIPANVVVPAGQTTATFPITTIRTDVDGGGQITATAEGLSVQTTVNVQAFANVTISQLILKYAEVVSGSVASLNVADNQYYVLHNPRPRGAAAGLEMHFFNPLTNVGEMRLEVEGSFTPGFIYYLEGFDVNTQSWISVATNVLPSTEARMVIQIPGNPSRFIDPVTGKVRVWLFLSSEARTDTPFTATMDQAILRVRP